MYLARAAQLGLERFELLGLRLELGVERLVLEDRTMAGETAAWGPPRSAG